MTTKKYQPPKSISVDHQEFLNKVGCKLKEVREGRGVSIYKLCKNSGVSRTGYYQIEAGIVYFNMSSLLNILEYHQISPENFFRDL